MLEPAKKNKGEGASSVHTHAAQWKIWHYSIILDEKNKTATREEKKKSREIVMGESFKFIWLEEWSSSVHKRCTVKEKIRLRNKNLMKL